MPWKFNRGEWTEAYVFLRLLGEGRIYGAKADLTRDDDTYISIINIIRDEPDQILIFKRFVEDHIDKVNVSRDGAEIRIVAAPEMSEFAGQLYESIKSVTSGSAFEIPGVQDYLESLGLTSPKANLSNTAKGKYGAKTDIVITSEDSLDHSTMTTGFSIKSHVGSSATLFNCSQTSGFTFEIVGCNERKMHELNSKYAFLSIIEAIREDKELSLKYGGCRNENFEQNIAIVDSRMEEILSEAILVQSSYYGECRANDVKVISDKLAERNPIEVRNPQMFYPAKFKDFLFASFAGMTASTLWNGRKLLTGGYIDVNRDGEMLYYRAMSDDVFANYLFEHTYFDRPDRGVQKDIAVAQAAAYLNGRTLSPEELHSLEYVVKDGQEKRNSKKGDFGYVYEKEGKYYIDFNFQIRFR